jgi:membrane peptidoglycan carboxypeptidase
MSTAISPNPPAAAPEAPRRASPRKREQAASTHGHPARRRRLIIAARIVLVALIALVTVFEVNVATDPSVTAAPARVVAIDRAHATSPEVISSTERIGEALIASEDSGFYSNDGLDSVALLRAFWGFLTGQDLGGSTIEIQLAHMLYPTVTEGLWGRVRRVSLALEFDTHFSKTAILSMYLSAVYFGHGFYGIRAASQGYFGVAPARLSWAQAALLAGIVQAPSALDPFRHLPAAEARMSYVLQRLVSGGALTAAQATQLERAPLGLLNRASAPN